MRTFFDMASSLGWLRCLVRTRVLEKFLYRYHRADLKMRDDLVHNDSFVVFRLSMSFRGSGIDVLLVKNEFTRIVFRLIDRVGNIAFLSSGLFSQLRQHFQNPGRLRFFDFPFCDDDLFHWLLTPLRTIAVITPAQTVFCILYALSTIANGQPSLPPNAAPQPRPEAGARHERTLEGVGCRRWFGWGAPTPQHRIMVVLP